MSATYSEGDAPSYPRKYDNVYYFRGELLIFCGKVYELLAHLPDNSWKVILHIPMAQAVETIYFDLKYGKWVTVENEPVTTK